LSSWQNTVLRFVIMVQGNKRRVSSAQAAHQRQQALALRPRRYAPPRLLDRTVRLSIETSGGWPVYTAAPRRGPATRHVLYLHGGAYIAEIKSFHWSLVGRLATQVPAEVTVPITRWRRPRPPSPRSQRRPRWRAA
jgi:acetyl esterase/lipase